MQVFRGEEFGVGDDLTVVNLFCPGTAALSAKSRSSPKIPAAEEGEFRIQAAWERQLFLLVDVEADKYGSFGSISPGHSYLDAGLCAATRV